MGDLYQLVFRKNAPAPARGVLAGVVESEMNRPSSAPRLQSGCGGIEAD